MKSDKLSLGAEDCKSENRKRIGGLESERSEPPFISAVVSSSRLH